MPRPTTIRTLLILSLSGFLGGAACFWTIGPGIARSAGVRPEPIQDAPAVKGWQKGKGWGWIWGKDDEVGALNGLTDAEPRRGARSWRRGARSSTWA